MKVSSSNNTKLEFSVCLSVCPDGRFRDFVGPQAIPGRPKKAGGFSQSANMVSTIFTGGSVHGGGGPFSPGFREGRFSRNFDFSRESPKCVKTSYFALI